MKVETYTIQAIAAHIRDAYGDDDDLVLGMIEGETDADVIVDKLIEAIAYDTTQVNAQKEWETTVKERRQRFERRIKANREAAQAVIEATGVDKWERPLATLSLSRRAPKRFISDEDALPDEFCKFKRQPVMAKINEAEDMPPGVSMDNGGVSLTVRMK